jgi:hypothetical protein
MLRGKARRRPNQTYPRHGRGCASLTGQSLRRGSIKIGLSAPYEDSFVLWLQAGNWFADIRATLDGTVYSGFGGVIEWHQPRLHFRHLINISGECSDSDTGDILLTRFGCIERGEFLEADRLTPFEEQWLTQHVARQIRVFVRYTRGVVTGLEVQLDRSCIVIQGAAVAFYTRFGAGLTNWRCRYASVDPNNGRRLALRRPARRACPAGWQLKEAGPSKPKMSRR